MSVPVSGTGVRISKTGVQVAGTGVRRARATGRAGRTGIPFKCAPVRVDKTGIRAARTLAASGFAGDWRLLMAERRIPRADGDFAAYANHYYEAVEKFWSVQGLDQTDLKPLKEALSAWNSDYPKHVAAQNAAEAARQKKDAAKRELERQIRPVSAFVQSYPKTTDADRATIGISVRDTGGTPTPRPASRPALLVEAGSRLTHRLRIVDESSDASGPSAALRKRRPRGTLGAEVYVALVAPLAPPPSDMSQYKFVRTVTRGAAEVTFQVDQGGQRAAYLVRWVSATGEPGPWSETVTATVAA
jgi:hypothetical protein